jgi:hypothetical protein
MFNKDPLGPLLTIELSLGVVVDLNITPGHRTSQNPQTEKGAVKLLGV